LKAENRDSLKVLGIFKLKRKVTAELTPLSVSKVAVQFKKLSIGPLTFNAPESFRGELDITYIDKDLRLSRFDIRLH